MSGGTKGRTRVVTRRGLRPDKAAPGAHSRRSAQREGMKRPHKYLADPIDVASEAPIDYRVEDGVLVDGTELRPNDRRAYDEWTRFWPKTSDEFKAEEAAWAAKSGPCVVIKQGSRA